MAGETTSRSGLDSQLIPRFGGPVVNSAVWTTELATTQLELNDVIQMGYIPSGATVIGFFVYSDDLDSNATPALASKITVGSTDVATALTTGRSAGGAFVGIEPVTVTSDTLVSVTFTTAAATAAAGTYALVPLYICN